MKQKMLLFMALICSVSLYAQNVSLNFNQVKLERVLASVTEQTGYSFAYSEPVIDPAQLVSINVSNTDVKRALKTLFDDSHIAYEIRDKKVFLSAKAVANAENNTTKKTQIVRGKITSASGESLPSVNVIIKGTTIGVFADMDGNYSITIPSNIKDPVLRFAFMGYAEQELAVGNRGELSVVLTDDISKLDEVVVVGYGTVKKINLTGSVASVANEDIKKASSSNITNALVGRLPGLVAVNESGKPGAGSKLLVRGMGTWNNSDPLVIVDGVERDFSHLDPNEVENISVLKDAAAAAVYGARAANGVILVTTRRGKIGKPVVAVDLSRGINSPTKYPELANPYEWATTRNSAYLLNGASADDNRIIKEEQLEKYRNGAGTDWYAETFNKTAAQYHANVNLSGGAENINYFVSLGHHNEDGLIDNFKYKKYNFRSNVDAKVGKRFKLGADVDATMRSFDTPGWDVVDLFNYVPRQNPTLESYHPNGLPANTNGEHLVEMVHNSGNQTEGMNDFRLTLKGTYEIPGIKGLNVSGMYSYGKNYTFNKKFFIPYTMYDVNDKGEITNTKVVGEKSKLDEKFEQGSGYTYNIALNYSQSFGKHDVGGLFLYEEVATKGNEFSAYRTNFVSNAVPQLFAGGDKDKSNTGKAKEWARNGLVGRFNYAYNHKYLFEASFRYDGSISFPKSSRYGFFPSASAAWRLSEESFVKDNFSFINNLKLRASYGILGNDRVDQWQYLSEFTYSGTATIGGENLSGIKTVEGRYPNKNITWEKSHTTDIGLEGSLWGNILSFEIDYFYKRTSDILAPRIRTIPSTFGAKLPDENYGILDNQGLEIMLSHKGTIAKDITYRVGMNYNFAKNKVVKFDESETTPEYYKVVGKAYTHKSDKGYPLAGHVGMLSDGIFQSVEEVTAGLKQFNGGQKPGDIRYRDVDGNNKVDEYDLAIVDKYGSIPEVIYGFNFNIGWKGLELTALFQGAARKSIMLTGYGTTMFLDGSSNFFNYLADESWTPENRGAQYPRAYVGANSNNNRASDVWLKKGDYLRLKNIELSYTFPEVILSKLKGISSIRTYVSGTNLLTFDSLGIMDPESSSGAAQYYPQQKSINFGINISF